MQEHFIQDGYYLPNSALEEEKQFPEYPGLRCRVVHRQVLGTVHQLYYEFMPPGGIKVKEETIQRAEAAATVQIAKDQRLNCRNPQQQLALAIYAYSREIVQEFIDLAGKPFEFFRMFLS